MNWIDLIIGTFLGVIFGEFFVKPALGPVISNRVTFIRKYFWKLVKPPNIPITQISSSKKLESEISLESASELLINKLNERGIEAKFEGNNINFSNYRYGKTSSSGFIRFHYKTNEKIESIEVDLTNMCAFQSLASEVIGLTNATNNMKELITLTLDLPIDFSDYLECNLNKLIELSGVFGNVILNYMHVTGDIDFDFNKNKVIFHKIIGPETIDLLKRVIILYY
ncbi:MAG: hypothetical protein NWE89_06060 [Candidatus Bathyarchaeota archaeon]|nr:hypothetical protein [Candidatus Bathyarchaeota archaeon]